MTQLIKRRFADLSHGQMHYRTAGAGEALLLLHGSPGSSLQQAGLIEDLSSHFTVYAPDTPGNGDSLALPSASIKLSDLAEAMLEFADVMGLASLKVYGFHTGGAIGAEIALQAPGRVKDLVIDGIFEPDDHYRQELLARYAKPFPADLEGAYLAKIFQFCRDQYIFFPWYRRSGESRRNRGLVSPDVLKASVQEVLKANDTYQLAYNACFAWPAAQKIPQLAVPSHVIASEGDPLFAHAREFAQTMPNLDFHKMPLFEDPDYRSARKSLLLSLLNTEASPSQCTPPTH